MKKILKEFIQEVMRDKIDDLSRTCDGLQDQYNAMGDDICDQALDVARLKGRIKECENSIVLLKEDVALDIGSLQDKIVRFSQIHENAVKLALKQNVVFKQGEVIAPYTVVGHKFTETDNGFETVYVCFDGGDKSLKELSESELSLIKRK